MDLTYFMGDATSRFLQAWLALLAVLHSSPRAMFCPFHSDVAGAGGKRMDDDEREWRRGSTARVGCA